MIPGIVRNVEEWDEKTWKRVSVMYHDDDLLKRTQAHKDAPGNHEHERHVMEDLGVDARSLVPHWFTASRDCRNCYGATGERYEAGDPHGPRKANLHEQPLKHNGIHNAA